MSSFKRLISGAMFGGVAMPAEAFAMVKWTVSCDGNYCCTVNQDTGSVGECWNK